MKITPFVSSLLMLTLVIFLCACSQDGKKKSDGGVAVKIKASKF